MRDRPDSLFFRSVAASDGIAASQRARMLDAITRVVARKGYARTTVADVVGLAGVSRRTFYEHFADKEACFLAAYEAGTDAVIADIERAAGAQREGDWRDRLAAALGAYTATLAAEPEFARALLIDVLGAGPRAVELRQEVYDRFVDQWRVLAELAGRRDLPDVILRAVVGGVAELVQRHILTEGAATLSELNPVLTQLGVQVLEGAGVGARSL